MNETYYIPTNFTDAGRVMGLFEIRNMVEAILLAGPALYLCLTLLPLALTPKLIVTMMVAVPDSLGGLLVALEEGTQAHLLQGGGGKMKVGLVAVDGHNNFPNLALMRLSAWHRSQRDHVEWWNGFEHYDRVYQSKVFTFTPDFNSVVNSDEIITGGTGYRDYGTLPPEVEATPPDYCIYPQCKRAIGFLTRGCIRRCEYCVVPRKEGDIRPAATWEEIRRPDSREILFLDNNVLASDFGLEQIDRMGGEPFWVDFNQGLDVRLITLDTARMLARLHWIRFIRMSCDTSSMIPVVERAAAYLREAGAAPSRFWAYVLVRDVGDAHQRVIALREMGLEPFAQPYRDFDGGEPSLEQRAFARWVNNRAAFHSCSWEDYQYPGKGGSIF